MAITRTRANRLYPTKDQRRVFKSWIGCARFVYNSTVEFLKTPGTKANWKKIKGGIIGALPEWAQAVPYQIKSQAVNDACRAMKALKQRNGELAAAKKRGERLEEAFGELGYRSRKYARQSCFIPGCAISPDGIYPTISGKGLIFMEDLPEKRIGKNSTCNKALLADARLVHEYGRWTLNIPETLTIKQPENQGRIVAIDPGVRTFATAFSLDECWQIGSGSFARIVRLAQHLDDLQSRLDPQRKDGNVGARRRSRMRKAAGRMRAKIRDLVDELHWQTITRLLERFDIILLPTFETSAMVTRAARKIRKKSVRSLLTWAHHRFAQRLEWKAAALGKTVLRVNEAYTSKTASWTGEVLGSLGGRRWIKSGGIVVDRDINGARGILLRALEDLHHLIKVEVVTC